MQYFHSVETKGLSLDWRHATGECEIVNRGEMSQSDVENALKHVVDVEFPEQILQGFCPPTIIVSVGRDLLHFTPAGRNFFCPEAGRVIGYDDACSLLRGETSLPPASVARESETLHRPRPKTSLLRRFFGVVIGVPVILFGGLVAMMGMKDNNLEGGLIGGGVLVIVGLVWLWRVGFRVGRGARQHSAMPGYMHSPYMYGDTMHGDDRESQRDGLGDDSGDSGDSGDD
ncbi:MAG: hypothetical protein ACNI3A_13055 [Desulfovibrio sp.]|uniref:hypothetical protein n=1 Tax=Desulfovibrio sp. 7SRBS1 TaxID=3378064 RepID=UPI003B3D4DA0